MFDKSVHILNEMTRVVYLLYQDLLAAVGGSCVSVGGRLAIFLDP